MTLQIQAPPLRRQEIIERAGQLIEQYRRVVGTTRIFHYGLHFDDVYEQVIYPEYQIGLDESQDLGTDAVGKKILGWFDPVQNKVFIDRSLKDDSRRAFTLWHEVGGHGVLQGAWLRDQIRLVHP